MTRAIRQDWVVVEMRSARGRAHEKIMTVAEEEARRYRIGSIRPATDEEIAAELSRRKQREQERRDDAAFRERPDYRDAMAIRDTLEFATAETLSRLTPEEWSELRRRLDA